MRPTPEFSAKDGMKMHLKIDKQQQLMQRSIDALIESSFVDEITTERLKEVFEIKSGKSKTTLKKVSVLEDIQNWVEKGDCSELTRASYNALALTLDEYEDYHSTELFWHQFTQKVFDSFLQFLQPKNLQNNTIWAYQKRLVACFNRAKKRGDVPIARFLEKRFKFRSQPKIYLNWEQIAAVLAFQPKTEQLRNAKKLFTILAMTGIRYSDLKRFLNNYEEGTAFNFSNFKASKHPNSELLMPAFLPVKEALKDGCPVVPINARLNVLLKTLCSQVLPYEIAKQVSCHTLRRSFISNFLSLAVVPEHILAKITGHSFGQERRVFQGYNRISLFENCQIFVRLVSAVDRKEMAGIEMVRFVEHELMN